MFVFFFERVLHTSSESPRFQMTRTPWRASTMILDVASVMVAPYMECGRDTLHEHREVHLWYLKKKLILISVFVKVLNTVLTETALFLHDAPQSVKLLANTCTAA